jgi:hypothetical protein
MSRWSVRGCIVVAALAVGACSSDPMAIEAQWRVRCPQVGSGTCVAPGPARTVAGEDGDPGFGFRCQVSDRGDGVRVVDMRIIDRQGDAGPEGSLELEDVRFREGQAAHAGRITALEDGSQFRGFVGDGEPCQVTGLRVDRDEDGRRALMGELLCRRIPSSVVATNVRDITAADSTVEPASFSVARCDGI